MSESQSSQDGAGELLPAPAAGTRGATAVRLYLEGYTAGRSPSWATAGPAPSPGWYLSPRTEADATTLRHLEYERLASMRDARGQREQGDVQAITAALKISERMSRLMGLDKPVV